MGKTSANATFAGVRVLIGIVTFVHLTGCSVGPATMNRRAFYAQSLIDFRGLKPVQSLDSLSMTGSIPDGWEPLPLKRTALYTHEQWRNASVTTGVGIAYIHTPLPLPASAILWFAKQEYVKHEKDGKSLGQWTDSLGREWFEAENERFHVRGYVITRGFDAWIVYCGYKRAHPPTPWDSSLASRSMETMMP